MQRQNKTTRRLLVLQRILQIKEVKAYLAPTETYISPPPKYLQQEYSTLFTQQFITFLSELICEFDQEIDQLYFQRLQNKVRYSSDVTPPKFLDTPQRRDKKWKINPLPQRLQNRNLDLGDVSPANEKHFLQALSADVQGIQVDFDDGHCPSWKNQILGLYNVHKVVHSLYSNIPDLSNIPILMLRPRAWNIIEHNIMVNGKKLPGPLVDFACLMFHCAQKLSENKNGPFFYLSKLEGASEARLWNNIFVWTQKRLNIPLGTIKACVLIENILSSFEMDEILFELREHSLGLNCGIWDYAASVICKFGDNPKFLLPDRNKYVNMDKHFLKKYMELVIQTCHKRQAPATGGMAAQLITNDSDINKVVQAKTKEIIAGCDGFMVYDLKLIPYMKSLWLKRNELINEKCLSISEHDLLLMPTGSVTFDGLNHNIQVAILFIFNWMKGKGHFYFKNSVEDSATAEISRSQIWQWIRHQAKLEHNGEIVTKNMIEDLSYKFIMECKENENDMMYCREIFLDLVTARYFVDFITSYLNDNFDFRRLQSD